MDVQADSDEDWGVHAAGRVIVIIPPGLFRAGISRPAQRAPQHRIPEATKMSFFMARPPDRLQMT